MPHHSSGSQQEGAPSDPHARQLEAVHAVSQEITRELDQKRLLELITRRATELAGGTSGGIYLWDEPTQLLSPHAYFGASAERMRYPRRPGEGLTGRVALERRGIMVNDYRSSPLAHPRTLQSTAITAAIAEPLLYHDRLLGVIATHHEDSTQAFTDNNQQILRLFAPQAAIAIENARLHGMAISRARQLATLTDLTRSLSTTLETTQVVQKALAAIQVLFPDCVAEFLELAPDGERLRLIDIVGLRAGRRFVRSEFRVKSGLVGLAAATQQPVTSPDVAQDPRFLNKAWAAEEGVVSAIVLPLIHQDRLQGVLSVLMRTPYRFEQEELDLVYSFAVHAAIAIENARLYGAAQRRAGLLTTLNDLGRTLSTTLDPQQVAVQILSAVRVLLPGAAVRLWEHGPEEGLFRHLAGIGLTPRAGPGLVRFSPGEGLMGRALQSRQPVISRDIRTDPRFREQGRARGDGLVSGLMLPLLARDRVCGILAIFTFAPYEFPPEELDLLNSFAAQAAAALENARLYDRLKQAYDEVRRAQEELVRSEKLRAVGQLGAGMAHDLNNVLAIILGQVELLKLRTIDPDVLDGLRTLEVAATDGAEVVRRVQDFARPRGASPLGPVDLSRLVPEALEITRPRWKDEPERRGVRIEFVTALPPLPPVLGHAPEIREALINLIFNAVDAMPQGGTLTLAAHEVPRTAGEAEREGAQLVELTVSDTGVGMSQEVRERIFEPFYSTKGPQGTGLGLSVVYGIMERHDGGIEVESRLGAGTTVRLRFQPAAELPAQPVPQPSAVIPRLLLLIDDDPTVRQTLGSLLRSTGHTVVEAESGAGGLARFGEAIPDLVITDLGMPDMTGWEVAAFLRAKAPSLPIVLLTGWGDQAAEAEQALTVDRILGKPVRLADLLAVIADLTGPDRLPAATSA